MVEYEFWKELYMMQAVVAQRYAASNGDVFRVSVMCCLLMWLGSIVPAPCYATAVAISPEAVRVQFVEKADSVMLVDVRGPVQYAGEHIAGAINVPAAGVDGHSFPAGKAIVLYCSATGCPLSERAAIVLTAKGYKDVSVLSGGIEAWKAKGFPVVAEHAVAAELQQLEVPLDHISAGDLRASMKENKYLVIDARTEAEYYAGHIPTAINVPVAELDMRLSFIPKSRPVVVYARSGQAELAAKSFRKGGYSPLVLSGGVQLWNAQGFPLEAGAGK